MICSAQSPRDLLNTITSRFAQNNHFAICSAQSPRDLLKTLTSRFAQHNHLLAPTHDKSQRQALDMHTNAVTAWPLQCTRYIRQLQKNILSLRTSDLHDSLFCPGEAGGLGIQQVAASVIVCSMHANPTLSSRVGVQHYVGKVPRISYSSVALICGCHELHAMPGTDA